jgi:hypothetical protein
MARRLTVLPLLAAAALSLGACGHKKSIITQGETEGVVVNVGKLKYQVQISRQLDPSDLEDRAYLVGVKDARTLPPGQLWFAVFMRVKNESSTTHQAAGSYEIVDTRGTVYRPVPVGADNVFAYHAQDVRGNGQIPDISSAAGTSVIQGALVLFKLPVATLDNRPLELRILQPGQTPAEASITLDV